MTKCSNELVKVASLNIVPHLQNHLLSVNGDVEDRAALNTLFSQDELLFIHYLLKTIKRNQGTAFSVMTFTQGHVSLCARKM